MKEKEVNKVDVHNDEAMVKLGIRKPNLQPRDPSVWAKTDAERRALKKAKARFSK